MASALQPSLLWSFNGSNVDSMTQLSPSFSTVNASTPLSYLPSYVAGKFNNAVYFNNQVNYNYTTANSYIVYNLVPGVTSNNSTFSMWINPQYAGLPSLTSLRAGTNNILQLIDSSTNYKFFTNGYVLPGASGGVMFVGGTEGSIAFSSSVQEYNTGNWCHLAVTLSNVGQVAGTTLSRFYFNGVFQGSNTHTIGTAGSFNSIWIAAQSNGGTDGVMGGFFYAQDLRIYNQALSAAQVYGIYQSQGIPPRITMASAPQPSLLWSFNGSNVDSVTQLSPSFSTVDNANPQTYLPSYVAGKFNNAVYFNNQNAYLQGFDQNTANSYLAYNITQPFVSNNMSFSFWMNPTYSASDTTAFETFIQMYDGYNYYNVFRNYYNDTKGPIFSNSQISGYGGRPAYKAWNTYSSATPYVKNKWYNIAVTLSNVSADTGNTIAYYYVNGVFQNSNTFSVAGCSTISKLYLGAGYYYGDPPVCTTGSTSQIQDVRLYNTALSSAQIFGIYQSGGIPPTLTYGATTPRPSLLWRFNGSNVDSVSGINPTIFPTLAVGYGQLVGSAAYVTAPGGSNVSLYLNGTMGTYMGELTTLSGGFNWLNSNLFVESWVYVNSFSTESTLINHGTNWSCGFTTTGKFQMKINSQTLVSYATIPATTWTHVAFSFNNESTTSNVMYIFVNGSLSGQIAFTGVPVTTYQSAYVGWNYSNFYVQDIRVAGGANNNSTPGYYLQCPTSSFTPVVGPFPLDNTPPTYVSGSTKYSGSTIWSLQTMFASASYAPGKYGKGLYLVNNALGSYTERVTLPVYLPTTSPFTISVWIKVSDPYSSTYRDFVALGGASTYISIGTPGWRSPVLEVYNNQSGQRYMQNINLNTDWFHIVCTNDGTLNNFIAYFNGGSPSFGAETTVIQNDTITSIFLGTNGSVIINDLRVYKQALTAAQVYGIYQNGGASPSALLTSG
jgi:hypothetical protein